MKKTFTQEELLQLCGCWKNGMLLAQKKVISELTSNKECTIIDILKDERISIQDKQWFLFNSCNLSLQEQQQLALAGAKAVVDNYNKLHPTDKRISMCINITARYLKGLVSIDVLLKYESAAWSAARSAAWSAAWSAARSAESAAWSAARSAWSAARSAESAAWSARSAARSAAWSAESAARSAAWSAAKLITYWIKYINTIE